MIPIWFTLIPPCVVIIMTTFTRNVLISLTSGIAAAALIAAHGSPARALALAGSRIAQEALQDYHLYTFGFLILLGILIQIMNHSGGIRAYTHLLLRYVTTAKGAQQMSLVLSSLFFIDDYVNNLTVGAIMRPIMDHFKVSRVKLAFLLDSMSAPVCLLLPASSWVAFILAQLQTTPFDSDPFMLYMKSMPYLLYPILIVFTAWVMVSFYGSYGAMRQADHKQPAHEELTQPSTRYRGGIDNFTLPISVFVALFVVSLLGGSFFLGKASFLEALQAADPFLALLVASGCAVGAAGLLFLYHNPRTYKPLLRAAVDGCLLMKDSLLLLLLAWTLGSLLKNDLQTGAYLASLLPSTISVTYLPALLFILSTIISASIGSSWGTIALMLPIAIPLYTNLAATALPGFYPALGALISGAVAGGHISPMSDAVLVSSLSAGCSPLSHVRTQASYASNALIGALVGYLSLIFFSASLSLPVALATTTGLLVIRNKIG